MWQDDIIGVARFLDACLERVYTSNESAGPRRRWLMNLLHACLHNLSCLKVESWSEHCRTGPGTCCPALQTCPRPTLTPRIHVWSRSLDVPHPNFCTLTPLLQLLSQVNMLQVLRSLSEESCRSTSILPINTAPHSHETTSVRQY